MELKHLIQPLMSICGEKYRKHSIVRRLLSRYLLSYSISGQLMFEVPWYSRRRLVRKIRASLWVSGDSIYLAVYAGNSGVSYFRKRFKQFFKVESLSCERQES